MVSSIHSIQQKNKMHKQCSKRRPSIQFQQQQHHQTSPPPSPKHPSHPPQKPTLIPNPHHNLSSPRHPTTNTPILPVVLIDNSSLTPDHKYADDLTRIFTENTQELALEVKSRDPPPKPKQDNKANRIHHLQRSNDSPFAQMFYGRSGIGGLTHSIFSNQRLQQSLAESRKESNLHLSGSNIQQGSRRSIAPAGRSSLSQAKETKPLDPRQQNIVKRLQNKSYSSQSQKENHRQLQQIQDLLNRAKQNIKRSELFRLSLEKQRVLDIKLRARIQSDIAHNKFKERIGKVSLKIQSASEEKFKKENISKNKLARPQLPNHPSQIPSLNSKPDNHIHKFKCLLQSRGARKLLIG